MNYNMANEIEKEQLEAAVFALGDKIRSKLHAIDKDLEDLEDIAIVLSRIDEPTVPWGELNDESL